MNGTPLSDDDLAALHDIANQIEYEYPVSAKIVNKLRDIAKRHEPTREERLRALYDEMDRDVSHETAAVMLEWLLENGTRIHQAHTPNGGGVLAWDQYLHALYDNRRHAE